MQVKIVDAIMGAGKTSAMIHHINNLPIGTRILYITPYLTEVGRVIKRCLFKAFKQPDKQRGSKISGIKELFKQGVNIASTHSLFREFDEEIIGLAFKQNYILVMDEVTDVVETLAISKDDLDTIRREYTEVVDGHILRWKETSQSYKGKFEEYKRLCDLGCVGIYNNNVILWLFPVSTFRGFSEIFILTHMFKAQVQKYYFDFYGIKYDYLYITGDSVDGDTPYTLTDEPQDYDYSKYAKLINVLDNEKMNRIGDSKGALSKIWYERNSDNKLIGTLKNNMINFFQHYAKTKTRLNMWTTFKGYDKVLKGKGYARGFVPLNTRATNDYKDKTSVAYCVNRYLNPFIRNFFLSKGIEVYEDYFALSEMLQWLFRSAIRDGKPIDVYIPSKRMRLILQEWLDEIANGYITRSISSEEGE